MKKELLAVLLGSLIILSGCTGISGGAQSYTSEYVESLNRIPASSPEEDCKVGDCTCMLCKKGPSILGIEFLTSYVGGHCIFDDECNGSVFDGHANGTSLLAREGYTLREFMIGQGPSFSDYGEANYWCNDGLKMATHWLIGSDTRLYDVPDPGRAVCMIDKGVMPVYVLYSRGDNITISRTREIAEILGNGATTITGALEEGVEGLEGPVGPVVVTTEIEFNGSSVEEIRLIADQVDVINEECNKLYTDPPQIYCMVAVAPRVGDYEALDAVLQEVADRHGGDYSKHVHLVAFGMNSHYVDGECNAGRIIEDARKFAAYAKNNKSLPSVIPYVLVDSGGGDINDPPKCTWKENEVVDTYKLLFTSGVGSLSKAGVIGFGLYTTYGDVYANPLQCGDCRTMSFYENDSIINLRKRAWFGNCQKYFGHVGTDATTGEATVTASSKPMIRYPSEEGGICDQGEFEVSAVFGVYMPDYAGQKNDIMDPQTPGLHEPIGEMLWTCDACISEKEHIEDMFPILKGLECPSGHDCPDYVAQGAIGDTERICTQHPEKDYYASRFNVDPILVRAFMKAENPCLVATVCAPGVADSSQGLCMQVGPELYNRGYNVLEDPQGICPGDYPPHSDPETGGYKDLEEEFGRSNPPYRYFAWGIGQITESPWTFWPARFSPEGTDGFYIEEWERAEAYGRGESIPLAKSCVPDGYFNPFNQTHSICVSAAKISGNINRSLGIVQANGLGQGDYYKDRVVAAFVAAYKILGIWDMPPVSRLTECSGHGTLGSCLTDEYKNHGRYRCEVSGGGGCSPSDACVLTVGGDCVPREGECYYDPDEPKDFLWFTHCYFQMYGVTQDSYRGHYTGFRKMGRYAYLVEHCENSYCPSWKRFVDIYLAEGGILDEFDRTNPFGLLVD